MLVTSSEKQDLSTKQEIEYPVAMT